jgi:hypothetical protein
MVLIFYAPKGTHSVGFLDNYTNLYIRDALLRVPGVGDIVAVGEEFSMRVWLKPDKLSQAGHQHGRSRGRPARTERAGGRRFGGRRPAVFVPVLRIPDHRQRPGKHAGGVSKT